MADVPLPPGADPEGIREWALGVMASFGLKGWTLKFNKRVRALGICRYWPRKIELSIHLVAAGDLGEIKETLLHEVAHALAGPGAGHGRVWRARAVEVGARPEPCGGEHIKMPAGRWQAVGGGCGSEFQRYRRPRTLLGWHCRGCGRERGRLEWTSS
jgi:hypothetical protein